jgi:hypothetical protein
VTGSKADKSAEYVNYAQQCLKIAEGLSDREARIALREMGAEWVALASQAATEDAASGKKQTVKTFDDYSPKLDRR